MCLLPVVLSRGPTTTIRPTTPFGLAVAVQWVNVLSKRNASSNIRNKYRQAFGGISSTSSLAVVPSSPLGGIRTTTTTTKTDKHGAKDLLHHKSSINLQKRNNALLLSSRQNLNVMASICPRRNGSILGTYRRLLHTWKLNFLPTLHVIKSTFTHLLLKMSMPYCQGILFKNLYLLRNSISITLTRLTASLTVTPLL